MSNITNDGLTWSGTRCCIAVSIWQQLGFQHIFCSSFKYLCKTAVERQGYYFGLQVNSPMRFWHGRVWGVLFAGVYMEWPLMKAIITITFCCNSYGTVSLCVISVVIKQEVAAVCLTVSRSDWRCCRRGNIFIQQETTSSSLLRNKSINSQTSTNETSAVSLSLRDLYEPWEL